MQARWHLLVVVFILANISLKAQDNGGCNDCPAFNASGKIEVRGVKERKIGRDTSELQSPSYLVCRLLLEKK